jgi:hypothetical protein
MTTDLFKTQKQENAQLYARDYYLWIQKTAELLEQEKFNEIDLTNLIEEIEDMGRSEKRAIASNLRILLMHLLKYQYQPQRQTNSWLFTIREHRKRLRDSFKNSPSLKKYYEDIFAESYRDARELAADETSFQIDTFPETSPFTPENALNPDYLPTDYLNR